ncbi:MAG: DNA-binding protein [Oscillospiraceae bacterium]|jgi:predicted DNA-binding protein with PD1-like motif|nr:DNA-binding protein [Oscillospiraceae bacterium]
MKTICKRLQRGDDLLLCIESLAKSHNIQAGVILSGVGCVLRARVRDASGVNVREIPAHCEIVSLNGTVSAARCHVHIALSDESLQTYGGHLLEGCIVNTTCELVIGVLDAWRFGAGFDEQTGYEELRFLRDSE